MSRTYIAMNDLYRAPALAPYLDTPRPLGAGTTRRVVALLTGVLVEMGGADRYVQASPERSANAIAAGLAAGRMQVLNDLAAAERGAAQVSTADANKFRRAASAATTCARLADLRVRVQREVERRRCLSLTTTI